MIEFNKPTDGYTSFVQHMLLSQLGVNKGINVFGQKGIDTVSKEMQQFHDREVIIMKNPSQLTKEERHCALPYLMLLKEKFDTTIKGRGCADGRLQRLFISKDQTSSPKFSNKALFLTLTIDAKEGRDVATCDIPGAFLQTDMNEGDDRVHIKLDGAMVELLAKINPQVYQKYIILSRKGKPVLYGETHKAIYGTLNASLLFYKKLVKSLQGWGFEINTYEWCCANKIIDGKQCTIVWHVDNIKISHVDPNVVTTVISDIQKEYDNTDTVKFNCGKVHN